jgi:hypothetical protein
VGECHNQADLMVLATKLVGISTGNRYLTWPSLDCDPTEQTIRTAAQAGITWDIDGDGEIGEEMLVLRFDFDGGDGTNINAFEGSVEFPSLGRYYAVWPSLEASSKCELLLEVRDHPLTFDPPEPPAVQCWAEVSNPWVCIIDPGTGELKEQVFPTCIPGCP